MAIERKRTRVQENGKITSPDEARREYDSKGDVSTQKIEIAHEVPRTAQEVALFAALDEIGAALRERGLSLEDMIERGKEIRGQLVEELYGIKSDADST
jgi:hypothetical protein